MRMISADSHINEPPDLWTARLPKKYQERAPRQERFEKGDAWVLEGALDPINYGANWSAGLPLEQRSAWCRWEDVRAGGYDPAARLLEQDMDGVDAEVLYPTPRVQNALAWNKEDKEFHVLCMQAYNDWLADFCGHDPARLGGVALLPNVGVDEAIAELQRTMAKPGIVGVLLGQWPTGLDLTAECDRFFAACVEANASIAVHVGFATEPPGDKARSKVRGDMRFFDSPVRIAQLMSSGALDKYPALQAVLVEVDCGWIPYLKEQMDDRHNRQINPPGTKPPSHYLDHNFNYVFITDTYGIRNRDRVGVERMMWSSDHPHGGSDWPKSREAVDEQFAGVPDDDKFKILYENAAKLYGIGTLARK